MRIQKGFLDGLAYLAYYLDTRHKKIARINLDFAYEGQLSEEERERIVKTCFKNLVHNVARFVRFFEVSQEKLLESIVFRNQQIVENALKEGRKIVFVSAHFGYWEIASLAAAARFLPCTVVGRPLEVEKLNTLLTQSRERYGVTMIGRKGALKSLIQALKRGQSIGLLVDQNTAENEGVLVDFFGKKARHAHTAGILARKFDATIIGIYCTIKEDETFEVHFHGPIETPKTNDADRDVFESVQAQAAMTEKVIRENPSQWFWFHRRWKNQYEEMYRAQGC